MWLLQSCRRWLARRVFSSDAATATAPTTTTTASVAVDAATPKAPLRQRMRLKILSYVPSFLKTTRSVGEEKQEFLDWGRTWGLLWLIGAGFTAKSHLEVAERDRIELNLENLSLMRYHKPETYVAEWSDMLHRSESVFARNIMFSMGPLTAKALNVGLQPHVGAATVLTLSTAGKLCEQDKDAEWLYHHLDMDQVIFLLTTVPDTDFKNVIWSFLADVVKTESIVEHMITSGRLEKIVQMLPQQAAPAETAPVVHSFPLEFLAKLCDTDCGRAFCRQDQQVTRFVNRTITPLFLDKYSDVLSRVMVQEVSTALFLHGCMHDSIDEPRSWLWRDRHAEKVLKIGVTGLFGIFWGFCRGILSLARKSTRQAGLKSLMRQLPQRMALAAAGSSLIVAATLVAPQLVLVPSYHDQDSALLWGALALQSVAVAGVFWLTVTHTPGFVVPVILTNLVTEFERANRIMAAIQAQQANLSVASSMISDTLRMISENRARAVGGGDIPSTSSSSSDSAEESQ